MYSHTYKWVYLQVFMISQTHSHFSLLTLCTPGQLTQVLPTIIKAIRNTNRCQLITHPARPDLIETYTRLTPSAGSSLSTSITSSSSPSWDSPVCLFSLKANLNRRSEVGVALAASAATEVAPPAGIGETSASAALKALIPVSSFVTG